MKKLFSTLLCCAIILGLFAGCAAPSDTTPASDTPVDEASPEAIDPNGTHVVIDHTGREVEVPNTIERIVVADFYPLASVLTVFLGSAEKIVGIHAVSMSAAKSGLLGELFPEILDANTGFMTGSDLNIEELMKLDPDVVFCSAGSPQLVEAISAAGIAVIAFSPSKWQYNVLETYDQWIATLSEIFPESDKSQQISEYSKEVYAQIQEKVSQIDEADKKKILFLFQYDETTMITSGKNFFGQFWCEASGGINVAEGIEADNSNAVISMEQVYEWDPEIIFITNFTPTQPEDIFNNAIGGDDWSSVKAVKNGEVYKLPLGTYRSYTPSADTPVTLMWIAQKVYPELFADLDITKEVKDYYMELYGVELTDEQVERMYNPSSAAAQGFKARG